MRHFTILFLSVLYASCALAQNDKLSKDQKAIVHVIEKEVNALNRDHDLEAYLSCFAQSDRIQVGPSNDQMTIGYKAVKANAEQVIKNYDGQPNPNTWSFAEWDIRVNGKTAFASCLQTTQTAEGTFIDVFKSDYLEKIDGEWKIVDHRYFHAAERSE